MDEKTKKNKQNPLNSPFLEVQNEAFNLGIKTGTITPESLVPSTNIEVEPAPEDIPEIDNVVPELELEEPKAETPPVETGTDIAKVETPKTDAVSDLTGAIVDTRDKLKGKSSRQSQLEEEQGLTGLNKDLKKSQSRISSLIAQQSVIEQRVQQESVGEGRTKGGAAPLTRGRLREQSIKIANEKSIFSMLQGNIEIARDFVEDALQKEFGSIEEELAIMMANLDTLIKDPALPKEDRDRADKKKADIQRQRDKVDTAKQLREDISNIMMVASENGADAETLRAIQNSASPQEAIINAGSFMQQPTRPSTAKAKADPLDKILTESEVEKIENREGIDLPPNATRRDYGRLADPTNPDFAVVLDRERKTDISALIESEISKDDLKKMAKSAGIRKKFKLWGTEKDELLTLLIQRIDEANIGFLPDEEIIEQLKATYL